MRPPARSWQPWPTTTPSRRRSTAPTIGLGVVRPRPRSASNSARGHVRVVTLRRSVGHHLSRTARRRSRRRERNQVVDALADADVADRQLQIVRDGDGDAALRGAVELGQHDAGDAGDAVNSRACDEAVLPDGRVEHQQDLVRRARHFAPGDAADLVELAHQIHARVQPAGGVDDHRIAPARLAAASASNTTAAGSAPGLRADHVDTGALSPRLELLDGRGAERVGGADQRLLALAFEQAAPACRPWSSCRCR